MQSRSNAKKARKRTLRLQKLSDRQLLAADIAALGDQLAGDDVAHEVRLEQSSLSIGAQDYGTGSGFIMHSAESLADRFSASPPWDRSSDSLIAVRHTGETWQYDTNTKWIDFDPSQQDRLLAEVDFGSNTTRSLKGIHGNHQGIEMGFVEGDLEFFAERFEGRKNVGEFEVTGTHFTFDPPVEPNGLHRVDLAGVNLNVGTQDGGVGSGYLMYSEQNVHSRFADQVPWDRSSEHFIAVRFTGETWQYDTNQKWIDFTPSHSDRLIAAVDFGRAYVKSLQGQSDVFAGIQRGFDSGDLSFHANQMNGRYNVGEYEVSGTHFAFSVSTSEEQSQNKLIDLSGFKLDVGAQDYANGQGYLMLSQEDLFERFSQQKPWSRSSERIVAVRLNGNQWQYDNNSKWINFQPLLTDTLIAEVDFDARTIRDLKGTDEKIFGVHSGYVDGNLNFKMDYFGGRYNKGEIGISGDFVELSQRAESDVVLVAVNATLKQPPVKPVELPNVSSEGFHEAIDRAITFGIETLVDDRENSPGAKFIQQVESGDEGAIRALIYRAALDKLPERLQYYASHPAEVAALNQIKFEMERHVANYSVPTEADEFFAAAEVDWNRTVDELLAPSESAQPSEETVEEWWGFVLDSVRQESDLRVEQAQLNRTTPWPGFSSSEEQKLVQDLNARLATFRSRLNQHKRYFSESDFQRLISTAPTDLVTALPENNLPGRDASDLFYWLTQTMGANSRLEMFQQQRTVFHQLNADVNEVRAQRTMFYESLEPLVALAGANYHIYNDRLGSAPATEHSMLRQAYDSIRNETGQLIHQQYRQNALIASIHGDVVDRWQERRDRIAQKHHVRVFAHQLAIAQPQMLYADSLVQRVRHSVEGEQRIDELMQLMDQGSPYQAEIDLLNRQISFANAYTQEEYFARVRAANPNIHTVNLHDMWKHGRSIGNSRIADNRAQHLINYVNSYRHASHGSHSQQLINTVAGMANDVANLTVNSYNGWQSYYRQNPMIWDLQVKEYSNRRDALISAQQKWRSEIQEQIEFRNETKRELVSELSDFAAWLALTPDQRRDSDSTDLILSKEAGLLNVGSDVLAILDEEEQLLSGFESINVSQVEAENERDLNNVVVTIHDYNSARQSVIDSYMTYVGIFRSRLDYNSTPAGQAAIDDLHNRQAQQYATVHGRERLHNTVVYADQRAIDAINAQDLLPSVQATNGVRVSELNESQLAVWTSFEDQDVSRSDLQIIIGGAKYIDEADAAAYVAAAEHRLATTSEPSTVNDDPSRVDLADRISREEKRERIDAYRQRRYEESLVRNATRELLRSLADPSVIDFAGGNGGSHNMTHSGAESTSGHEVVPGTSSDANDTPATALEEYLLNEIESVTDVEYGGDLADSQHELRQMISNAGIYQDGAVNPIWIGVENLNAGVSPADQISEAQRLIDASLHAVGKANDVAGRLDVGVDLAKFGSHIAKKAAVIEYVNRVKPIFGDEWAKKRTHKVLTSSLDKASDLFSKNSSSRKLLESTNKVDGLLGTASKTLEIADKALTTLEVVGAISKGDFAGALTTVQLNVSVAGTFTSGAGWLASGVDWVAEKATGEDVGARYYVDHVEEAWEENNRRFLTSEGWAEAAAAADFLGETVGQQGVVVIEASKEKWDDVKSAAGFVWNRLTGK